MKTFQILTHYQAAPFAAHTIIKFYDAWGNAPPYITITIKNTLRSIAGVEGPVYNA